MKARQFNPLGRYAKAYRDKVKEAAAGFSIVRTSFLVNSLALVSFSPFCGVILTYGTLSCQPPMWFATRPHGLATSHRAG